MLKITSKFFLLIFCVLIFSCNHLKSQNKNEDEIYFFGKLVSSVTPIDNKEALSISNFLNKKFKVFQSHCKKKPTLKDVQSFSRQLEELHKWTGNVYNKYTYSFNNAKIKDGNEEVNLAVFIQNISSILENDYKMKYDEIEQSTDLQTACNKLKSNYIFSYKIYYNIQDGVDLSKEMSFWAKKILDSINCLCP